MFINRKGLICIWSSPIKYNFWRLERTSSSNLTPLNRSWFWLVCCSAQKQARSLSFENSHKQYSYQLIKMKWGGKRECLQVCELIVNQNTTKCAHTWKRSKFQYWVLQAYRREREDEEMRTLSAASESGGAVARNSSASCNPMDSFRTYVQFNAC